MTDKEREELNILRQAADIVLAHTNEYLKNPVKKDCNCGGKKFAWKGAHANNVYTLLLNARAIRKGR